MAMQFCPVAQWLAVGEAKAPFDYQAYKKWADVKPGRRLQRLKQSRDQRQLLASDSLEQGRLGMVVRASQSGLSLLGDLVQKALGLFRAQPFQGVEQGLRQRRGGGGFDLPVLGFVFHFSISKGVLQPQESLSPGGEKPRRPDDGSTAAEVNQ